MLPLALLTAGVVAALLGGQQSMPGWFAALAMLLTAAGALVSGGLWGRQCQLDKLRDARLQAQMLGQLIDLWQWQTDAEHRLVRLQPPNGAPASCWIAGAFSGQCLWERFDDGERSLQARMQAHAPLSDLRVGLSAALPGSPHRRWRLRGLPCFDGRGRFAGYLGLAAATDRDDARDRAEQALDTLLQKGPVALCLAVPDSGDRGWLLQAASPAARTMLGLGDMAPAGQPLQQALAALPDTLREQLPALAPGGAAEAGGWQVRMLPLGPDDPAGCSRLLALSDRAHGQARRDEATARAAAELVANHAAAEHATRQAADQAAEKAAEKAAIHAAEAAANAALAAEHAAFVYTVSHDLRAPIRVIEGFGRILKEDQGAALDRIGNDHLDRMMAAAARMNHMIDALLSLSRLSTQPLACHPVNLTQLANHVVDELRRGAPGRQVAVRIAPGLAAPGDPTLLRMALDNLLGNAWKYSGRRDKAEISFQAIEQDGRRVFMVSDNGAGFDMRFADRLFGVFQRLHPVSEFQGTGVGLASVRRIIRRHGGEIWAESEVGQGARFYFTLQG